MKKYACFLVIVAALFFTGFLTGSAARAQSLSFNSNLSIGASGADVANLQSWLMANGFTIPALTQGTVKGYFGGQTQNALAAYQRSVGLPSFGYFGPMTRAILNGGQGSPPQNAPLQVISPNGGETWSTGTTQYIRWTGSPSVLNQTADIRLEFPLPACAQPGQPIRCMIMVRAPYLIATGVNLNSGSYAWNVGAVSDFSGSNPTMAANGTYKVQICPTNGSSCVESTNTFTVTSGTPTASNSPVINGIDAPTTLAVGQTGTWTIHATDPLNGTLSYSVLWGDEPGIANTGGTMMVPAAMQTSMFTHAYANSGTYMVTFTVRNSAGISIQTSASVQVTGNSTTAGPLRITSPNGGEVWQNGTTHTITWTSPYYFQVTTVDLTLQRQIVCTTQVCPMIAFAPQSIATNIPINQNSYMWNTSTIQPGQYTIQMCQSGTSNCDSSDGPFTIGSTVSSNATVSVVSPNGGEVWTANTNQVIRWALANNTDPNAKVDIYLGHLLYIPCVYGAICQPQFQTAYVLDRNIAANSTYNWIVATDINNQAIPAGNYVMRVCMAGSTTNCGTSAGNFAITAPNTY